MKPPRPEAINQALGILMTSIYEENPNVDRPRSVMDMEDLNGAEFHLAACEMAIESFRKQGMSEVCFVRRYRNGFSPINYSLPLEMLSNILFLSMNPLRWRHSLQTLAGVCRRWRKVIISCPRFWTRIDGTYSPQLIGLYLQRSEPAALNISYDLDSPHAAHLGDAEQFIRLVSPHARRWATFTFSGFPPPNLAACLNQICPDLQELKLKIWNEPWPPIQSWNMPSAWFIRRILLQNLSFNWTFMFMHGIHAIKLQSVEAPSLSTLLRVIISSPELEVLILSNLIFKTPVESDDDMVALNLNHSPIEFPILKTLHLTSIPQLLFDYLLVRVVTITATHVVSERTSPECFASAQSPLMRSIANAVRHAEGLEIVVREEGSEIRISTLPKLGSASGTKKQFDGVDLRSTTHPDNLMVMLELVARTLGPISSSVPVHLTIEAQRKTATFSNPNPIIPSSPLTLPISLPSSFTSLSSLRLIGDTNALAVFRQLSVPQVDSLTKVADYPCNQLKVMDLASWDGEPRHVVAFVLQRWGGLTLGGTALPAPPKLEHLILPSHGSGQVQYVRHAAVVCEAISG